MLAVLVLLATIVVVFAAAPMCWSAERGRAWLLPGLVVLATVAAFTLRAERSAPATRPLEELQGGYAGSGTCRSCHPTEHASWAGSFHRTMTQVASRASVAARFERVELDWFGKPVVLEWRGDELWATFDRGGRSPAHVERPVQQLTGSHHLQVLWYSTGNGRELAPLPLVFEIAGGAWLPMSAVFVVPPDMHDPPEPGTWSRTCSSCHATDARPRFDERAGQRVNDTRVGELGIACEACHGPGAAHVAANQNPLLRYQHRSAGADATIVNPARLLPVRSAQVCGHCHAVSIPRQQHHDEWSDHGSPFVPGRDLQSTHVIVDPRDRDAPELEPVLQRNPGLIANSFWSDGEVRVSGREFNGLRRSPCYTHGDTSRQLDCTSCHTMHHDDGDAPAQWRDDQLRPGMRGNTACTQCHGELGEPAALAAHTHHGALSSGSNCMDCHMPHTALGLMKASRSHTVTSPSVQSELATGRPNACNQCHLDRTLQWTAEQLHTKWGIEVPALDGDQRSVAASVRWLLAGDAGQRMLAAWSFGWRDAQAASGTDWMVPFLARLLDDPYYVVRRTAARSLGSLPGDGERGDPLAGYAFLAPAAAARAFGERVHAGWTQSRGNAVAARPAVLLGEAGFDDGTFQRLFARRDDRRVYLAE